MTGSNEKKNNNKEKRKRKYFGADPKIGYCPLSIRLGVQARRQRWALGWAQADAECEASRRARGARSMGTVRVAMHCLGVLLGQQAVHSVHSTCLTQFQLSTVLESIFGIIFLKKKQIKSN